MALQLLFLCLLVHYLVSIEAQLVWACVCSVGTDFQGWNLNLKFGVALGHTFETAAAAEGGLNPIEGSVSRRSVSLLLSTFALSKPYPSASASPFLIPSSALHEAWNFSVLRFLAAVVACPPLH